MLSRTHFDTFPREGYHISMIYNHNRSQYAPIKINVYHPLGPADYNCHFPMFDLPNPNLLVDCSVWSTRSHHQLTIEWMCIYHPKAGIASAHASHQQLLSPPRSKTVTMPLLSLLQLFFDVFENTSSYPFLLSKPSTQNLLMQESLGQPTHFQYPTRWRGEACESTSWVNQHCLNHFQSNATLAW